MCPDCEQKGRYEGRVLINGRGFYQCPEGHRWQSADEAPTTKGVPLMPAPPAAPRADG